MPGKEIKGRSARANYSHGGRVNLAIGTVPKVIKAGKEFIKFIKSGKYIDKDGNKLNVDKIKKLLKEKK